MATIVKRTVKGIQYYYLEHAIREKGRVDRRSVYLGRTIPEDIERIKERLLYEINKEKWFGEFDKMKERYANEAQTLPESASKKEMRTFSVRFTYDTQRMEGSTLSLGETSRLLLEGITPGGKPVEDVKEAEAHQKVFLAALEYAGDLSLPLVLDWHWKIFQQTKPDIAGKVRRHAVRIAGSNYVPPTPVELQALLTELFEWYDRRSAHVHPVELAALVHFKFVTIHPFSDGNGRLGRLFMNFVLNRHGYPMLSIEYRRRAAYYRALERAQITKEDRRFTNWFFRRYKKASNHP